MKVPFCSFLFFLLANAGVEARVGEGETKPQQKTRRNRKTPDEFSIRSLDDPRLFNPWAGRPKLYKNSSLSAQMKAQKAQNERLLQSLEDEPNEYPEQPKMNRFEYWEVIIVGAGPGGIMAAKTILDASPDTKVLILERGPPLEDFKAKGYDDALQHNAAAADPDFREDVEGTPIVVGTGVGGGTLHFGMQFIDQDEVADASSRQPEAGEAADLRDEVGMFAYMTGATSYSDEDYYSISSTVGDTYTNFINEINAQSDSFEGKLYRNNVYKTGNDLEDQPRLLLGDLLKNSNVEIRTGVEVLSVIEEGHMAPNSLYYKHPGPSYSRIFSDHIVLAAGALNSARLALNAGIVTPTGQTDDGKPYLGPLWDHQGLVITYFAPGTTFTNSSTDVSEESVTDLGLQVFESLDAAQASASGFAGIMQLPVLTQEQVDSLVSGQWTGSDPTGSGETYSYVFDFPSGFFMNEHPGGDQTAVIMENGYNVGFVLDTIAPETHKVDKLLRLSRAGATLMGVLEVSSGGGGGGGGGGGAIEFDYSVADVAGDQLIGHLQTRPDDHDWQYYYTTAGDSNLIVGVSTTGELIEDNGRVYGGDALGPDTVDLPTLEQRGFEAIMEGIKKNHEVLTNLGFFTEVDIDAITDIATLENTPGYLPTTYHYHGTLSQTALPTGFYSGDLARMKSKWAGSTSVAAAAMGIQAGNDVLCDLGMEQFCSK